MAFSLPNFNVRFDYWTVPPPVSPPAPPTPPNGTFMGQLYVVSKGILDIEPGFPDLWVPPVWIRLSFADFSAAAIAVGSIVQAVPVAVPHPPDTLCYMVRWWEVMHLDFPNMYVQMLCEQSDNFGVRPDPRR